MALVVQSKEKMHMPVANENITSVKVMSISAENSFAHEKLSHPNIPLLLQFQVQEVETIFNIHKFSITSLTNLYHVNRPI